MDIYKFIQDEYNKHEASKQNSWDSLSVEEKYYFAWEVCCKVNSDYYNSYNRFNNYLLDHVIKEIEDSKVHITRDSAVEIIKTFIDKHKVNSIQLNFVGEEFEIGKSVVYINGKII